MRIDIDNLLIRFNGFPVLKEVSLTIPTSSRVGLIGPNGSGKTTLLRAMLNLVNYQGVIKIGDEMAGALPIRIKNQLAYIPQISPYFSSRVEDILEVSCALKSISKKNCLDLLKRMDLDYASIEKKSFRTLSGGMKQKFMIALAFSHEAAIIFLDEPTSSLDAKTRETFYKLCQELDRSTTFVLCSHRMDEIRHIIDHAIVLEAGSIVYKGSSQDYLHQQVSCLLEVYVPLANENPSILQKMKELKFFPTYTGWWYSTLPQNEKMKMLNILQTTLENHIVNINIRDIDINNVLK